jgi:hypothetical protein
MPCGVCNRTAAALVAHKRCVQPCVPDLRSRPFWLLYATHPVTLTVAIGSVDVNVTRLMCGPNGCRRAAGTARGGGQGTALDAVNAGDTDPAVARAATGDLSAAHTVVVMTYALVLIAVPQAGTIDSVEGLKGKPPASSRCCSRYPRARTAGKVVLVDQKRLLQQYLP